MWMGGVPPFGYRAQDRKLIIVDNEAKIVRFIYRRYAELGSVRLLKDELESRSIQSKLRTSAAGRISGGKPFIPPSIIRSIMVFHLPLPAVRSPPVYLHELFPVPSL